MKKWLIVLLVVGFFISWQKEVWAVAMTGTCGWCGATCQRSTVGQVCIDVLPPTGKICVEESGACVMKDATAKAVSGEAFLYLNSVNTVDGATENYEWVDLGMEANTTIGGVDIWLTFNPEVWQLMKVESLSGPNDKFVFSFSKDLVKINNSKGTVSVALFGNSLATLSQAQIGTIYKQSLLRFGFKPIKSGTHLFDFVCKDGVDTDTNIFDKDVKDIINCSKNIPLSKQVILPVVTDTVLPTQGQGGCVKNEGDANGDQKMDLVDFGMWKSEYLASIKAQSVKSDFNCDGKADLVDFGIWKKSYLNNQISMLKLVNTY